MGTTFYFGRIHFDQVPLSMEIDQNTPEFDEGNIQRMRDYIDTNDHVFVEEDGRWRFGRYREIEGENFLIGKFGKEFVDKNTRYDDNVEDFVDMEEDDADVSYFALFIDTGIIAFSRKLRIGPQQFTEAFSTGYNQYHDVGARMSIEILENNLNLEDVFRISDTVNNVDFELIPTNPEANDEMEKMDQRFKEAEADSFEIEADSDSGLNVSSRVIKAGREFVKNDYGEAVVRYYYRGRSEQFSTKTESASMETNEDPDDLNEMQSVVSQLKDQATGVLSRIREDD